MQRSIPNVLALASRPKHSGRENVLLMLVLSLESERLSLRHTLAISLQDEYTQPLPRRLIQTPRQWAHCICCGTSPEKGRVKSNKTAAVMLQRSHIPELNKRPHKMQSNWKSLAKARPCLRQT